MVANSFEYDKIFSVLSKYNHYYQYIVNFNLKQAFRIMHTYKLHSFIKFHTFVTCYIIALERINSCLNLTVHFADWGRVRRIVKFL